MLSSDDDSGREESPPAQSSPTTIVETPSATVSPASTATGSRRSPRVLPPTPSTPRRSPRDHVRSPRNSTATSGASPAASNPAKKKKESGGDAAGKRGEGDCESTSSDGDTDDSDYVPDGQSSSGSSRTASPHAKKKKTSRGATLGKNDDGQGESTSSGDDRKDSDYVPHSQPSDDDDEE